MTNLEINRQFAELLGMTAMKGDNNNGGFWDEGRGRTRMLRDSVLHERRKGEMCEPDGFPGFIFDVFANSTDMERVEKALGIESPDLKTRAARAVERMAVKK